MPLEVEKYQAQKDRPVPKRLSPVNNSRFSNFHYRTNVTVASAELSRADAVVNRAAINHKTHKMTQLSSLLLLVL